MRGNGWLTRPLVALMVIASISVAGIAPAVAAPTRVWVGPENGLWSVPENWAPVGVPVDGETLMFEDAAPGASVDDIAALSVDIHKTGNAAASVTAANGAQITLSGPIVSNGDFTIAVPATVNAQRTLTVNSGRLAIGPLSGTGGISRNGVGTLELTTANTYTGPTILQQGVTNLVAEGALGGTTSGTTVASGATLVLFASAGSELLNISGTGAGNPTHPGALNVATSQVATPITVPAPGALVVTANPSVELSGTISGSGALTLLGSFTVTRASTRSGLTNIGSGTLVPTLSNALGNGSVQIGSGGALELRDGVNLANRVTLQEANGPTNPAIRTTAGAAVGLTGGLVVGAPSFVDVAAGTELQLNGGVQGSAALGKQGPGGLTLGGSVASATTGAFTISEGRVRASAQPGRAVVPANTTVGVGGQLDFAADDQVSADNISLGGAYIDLSGTDQTVHQIGVTGRLLLGAIESGNVDAGVLTTDEGFVRGALELVVGGTSVGTTLDQVRVNDAIDISGAALTLKFDGQLAPATTVRLVDNRSASPIAGTFDGLAEGATIANAGVAYVLSYSGGDGNDVTLTRPAIPPPLPPPVGAGYWMVGLDGGVFSFGGVAYHGRSPATNDIVDIEPTTTGRGYWVATARGAVHAFGDAIYHGEALNQLGFFEFVVSMSATPTGNGYWLFTSRGRVVPFGAAPFRGDVSALPLNGPILDSVATPSGNGYYMVASDGGVFSFGDAAFYGSMGGTPLNAPVMGIVPDSDNAGYWLVASDGGIFSFSAPFRGSMGGTRLNRPVIGMVRFGSGYLMVAEDGGIFTFSDRPFFGSLGSTPLAAPIVGVAAHD